MGYAIDSEDGAVVLSNGRGAVRFVIDGKLHTTRLAILAIVARVVHGPPSSTEGEN